MVVQEITRVTDRKRRIHLADGTSFVLYAGEVRSHHIEAGADLSDETLRMIREEVLIRRARLRCLNLLKSMDRTQQQLRRRLSLDGYPNDVIDDALAYASSYHYTDDARYAENYVRQMTGRRSRKQIEWELREKGIPKDLILSAFETETEEDPDLAAALRFARKRNYDPETAAQDETRRFAQFLMRRGFSGPTIRKVVSGALSDSVPDGIF